MGACLTAKSLVQWCSEPEHQSEWNASEHRTLWQGLLMSQEHVQEHAFQQAFRQHADPLHRTKERETMIILHQRGAGLDVHKPIVVACCLWMVQDGTHRQETRTFGTTTAELLKLLDWLHPRDAAVPIEMGTRSFAHNPP